MTCKMLLKKADVVTVSGEIRVYFSELENRNAVQTVGKNEIKHLRHI